jgi:hypothetical protein
LLRFLVTCWDYDFSELAIPKNKSGMLRIHVVTL